MFPRHRSHNTGEGENTRGVFLQEGVQEHSGRNWEGEIRPQEPCDSALLPGGEQQVQDHVLAAHIPAQVQDLG